ncbi:Sec-independent protein translocase protein TatB [Moraxella nasovis]|uniref:Sec-independent protein translocase protein TatB n=1 Tax=Moraxella nasovis TaxID=2904121 RepID=UPI001F603BC1|nr:Sec-independent protein translocase protein TatB [Moraxella nasovis]UNU72621.1 Sec-independent protein translocase protein TatB [Moraxella nasovis]
MLNLGFFELTLLGIIALIVLGPEKLPVVARTLGKWYGNIRRLQTRLKDELMSEFELAEATKELQAEIAKIRQSERAMKAQMQKLQRTLDEQYQDTAHQDPLQNKSYATADDIAQKNPRQAQKIQTTQTALNLPLANHWFLLGEYDKNRRLPVAPFLPNYTADTLLHNPYNHHD